MLTTSTHTQPQPLLSANSRTTTPQPSVPKEQSLSPQEIERICKAFIRLITAKEIPTHDDKTTPAQLATSSLVTNQPESGSVYQVNGSVGKHNG